MPVLISVCKYFVYFNKFRLSLYCCNSRLKLVFSFFCYIFSKSNISVSLKYKSLLFPKHTPSLRNIHNNVDNSVADLCLSIFFPTPILRASLPEQKQNFTLFSPAEFLLTLPHPRWICECWTVQRHLRWSQFTQSLPSVFHHQFPSIILPPCPARPVLIQLTRPSQNLWKQRTVNSRSITSVFTQILVNTL